MRLSVFILSFLGLVLICGCTTESWSYLYTQQPSALQRKQLLSLISTGLVDKFGFSKVSKRSEESSSYSRNYDSIGLVKVQLSDGKYPLIYFTIPKSHAEAPEIIALFKMVEESYVLVGLPRPRGPAEETWFGQ
jgi:hypothetical protein